MTVHSGEAVGAVMQVLRHHGLARYPGSGEGFYQ
jgi:hypothetical protein